MHKLKTNTVPHSGLAAVRTRAQRISARTGTGNRSVIVECGCDLRSVISYVYQKWKVEGIYHISPHVSTGHKGQKAEIKIREFTKKSGYIPNPQDKNLDKMRLEK